MGKAYTKEDVVGAALHRFKTLPTDRVEGLAKLYNEFYDKMGKVTFRTYASVTPQAMKDYFESQKCLNK